MGLLDLFVGADAARQFRERMSAASATANAAFATATATSRGGTLPQPSGAMPSQTVARSGSSAAPRPGSAAAPLAAANSSARIPTPADPLGLAGFDGSDFPTSILASAAEPAQPLLSAFASRPSLLAAIVFSEALAPPVALR